MFGSFFTKFDKTKFSIVFPFTMLFLFFVIILNIIDITYSRYQSNANMNVQANIAFFLLKQGTYNNSIALTGLEPSNDAYVYVIDVKNYDGNERCDVDLSYNLSIETTTNLPLEFSVYRNEDYSSDATNIIDSFNYIQDEDVYYKVHSISDTYSFSYDRNEHDYYTIVVKYPLIYKNYPDLYQGKIDLITVTINAFQVA